MGGSWLARLCACVQVRAGVGVCACIVDRVCVHAAICVIGMGRLLTQISLLNTNGLLTILHPTHLMLPSAIYVPTPAPHVLVPSSQFLYVDDDGYYHAVFHHMYGTGTEDQWWLDATGGHAFSKNG